MVAADGVGNPQPVVCLIDRLPPKGGGKRERWENTVIAAHQAREGGCRAMTPGAAQRLRRSLLSSCQLCQLLAQPGLLFTPHTIAYHLPPGGVRPATETNLEKKPLQKQVRRPQNRIRGLLAPPRAWAGRCRGLRGCPRRRGWPW